MHVMVDRTCHKTIDSENFIQILFLKNDAMFTNLYIFYIKYYL